MDIEYEATFLDVDKDEMREKLKFDYKKALFCAIGHLYKIKYGVSLTEINNKTPRVTFETKNPFLKS